MSRKETKDFFFLNPLHTVRVKAWSLKLLVAAIFDYQQYTVSVVIKKTKFLLSKMKS